MFAQKTEVRKMFRPRLTAAQPTMKQMGGFGGGRALPPLPPYLKPR